MQTLNQHHLEARQHEAKLEARIHSLELAYRMQMEASDAFDLSKEPAHIHEMYGERLQARLAAGLRKLLVLSAALGLRAVAPSAHTRGLLGKSGSCRHHG